MQISAKGTSRATPLYPGIGLPKIAGTYFANLSAVWADSNAEAEASVANSAITAGNQFTLSATTSNFVDAVAMSTARNTVVNLTYAGSDTTTTTTAVIGAGTTVEAGSVDVSAESSNEVGVAATLFNVGASGLGLCAVTNFLDTDTSASIAGDVTTTSGDVSIRATAETENVTGVDSRHLGSTGSLGTQINNQYNQFWRDQAKPFTEPKPGEEKPLFNWKKKLVEKMFPVVNSGKLNLSGGVAIADAEQDVNAYVAEGGRVDSSANVKIAADLNDRTNLSAVAQATSDQAALGGAVIVADCENEANAYIGRNAVVDADRAVYVDS